MMENLKKKKIKLKLNKLNQEMEKIIEILIIIKYEI